MNLHNLAKFIVFIWLPLATSELQEKNKIFSIKKETFSERHAENSENTENNAEEENSAKTHKNQLGLVFNQSHISTNYSSKNSANGLESETDFYVNNGGNHVVAHKLKGSIKKDLSALNTLKNRSATKLYVIENNKRQKSKPKIRKRKAAVENSVGEDPHSPDDYEEEEAEDIKMGNTTELGSYLGGPCESTCSKRLLHVICHPKNKVCECEDKYPVKLGAREGCEKPKLLGDQCFYSETCSFLDSNAVCKQIDYHAMCQCKPGFHAVALRKGVRRMFCSEDVSVVSADLSTLLGVATGIAVLTGLLCFVLRLFNGNRYPRTRRFANTNIAPPLLLSNDNQWVNGIPLALHGRPPSRASYRSTMSLSQHSRSKGVMVPASRAGAARAAAILLIPCNLQSSRQSEVINSEIKDDTEQLNDLEQTSCPGSRRQSLSSVQSTTSSQKSLGYGARRYEQETQQKEQRAAVRAAKEEAARVAASLTPSPMSSSGIIPPFTKDSEEEPLCSRTQEPPPESEPPAFSIA